MLPTGGRVAGPGIVLAAAGQGHVEDLFLVVAAVQPDLDDLDAVEVGAVWVLHGLQHEARRAAALAGLAGRSPPMGTPSA